MSYSDQTKVLSIANPLYAQCIAQSISVRCIILCKIELWTEVGLSENPMEVVPILDEVELKVN